jgi:hypothetical protein
MGNGSTTRRRARTAGLVAGLAALATAAALAQAPPASAGLAPTTTTVSASSSTAFVTTPVTFTATVSILGLPGLLVTPTGTVAFTATNGSTTTSLGTAALGTCLLTSCTASLTTSALTVGTNTVTGTYSGDTVAAPSSGSTTVTVGFLPEPTPTVSDSSTCSTGGCSVTVTTPDGNNVLTVSTGDGDEPADDDGDDTGPHTVSAALTDGATLDCPTPAGDTAVNAAMGTFSSTGTGGKTLTRTYYDLVTAQKIQANYARHTTFLGCYASPTPFNGYSSTGVYGPAPLVTTPYGYFYEAYLGNCSNNSGALPCFRFTNGLGTSHPYVTLRVKAPQGDPKLAP